MEISDVLEEIKKINLKSYLEQFYNIEFIDNKCRCLIPEHNDKNPSMQYYEDSNRVVCFSCLNPDYHRKPLDIITAVGLLENIEPKKDGFIKVVKKICLDCELSFPEFVSHETDEQRLLKSKKLAFAEEFKIRLWNAEEGFKAMEYLLNRGFSKQTIRDFHLGLTSCNEHKYHLQGVNNRISIPILNKRNEVVAISFRDLDHLSKNTKYKHDAKDCIWNKKEILYGYPYAIDHVRTSNHLYIVEGYFDLMSLYQVGIKNCVASMTNILTDEQILEISKITKNVTLILDQDEPGQSGFLKTTMRLSQLGVRVRAVESLGFKGKDMNDLCNALDWNSQEIRKFLSNNSKDAILSIGNKAIMLFQERLLNIEIKTHNYIDVLVNSIQDDKIKESYRSRFEKMMK